MSEFLHYQSKFSARNPVWRIKNSLRHAGVLKTVTAILNEIAANPAKQLFYRHKNKNLTFSFSGNEYPYFYHRYNTTWINERAIEIPIALRLIDEASGKRILEVGNVLSRYMRTQHDIIDKYEIGPGVLNIDVIDFSPEQPYDLIVSISTLEHVGWDEEPREPKKVAEAIANLKQCLSPGGKLVFTVPAGYNFEIQRLIDEGKLGLSALCCFKRLSKDSRWIETDWDSVKNVKVHEPYPFANALILGVIINDL